MIKAEELRIGNLVESIGIEYLVWKIDGLGNIQGIDGGTTFNLDKTTYPIKITEKWLLKIGFEKYEFDHKENQYRHKDRLIVLRDGKFVDYGSSVTLEYVHQLQNLYFALTGEELTLNPE
jgi:hypothetical protein